MREDPPDELFKKIATHDLDIALTNNLTLLEKNDLEIKQVGTTQVSIYGSKKYKNLSKNFPNSLNGSEFILPTIHSKLRYDLEHSFRSMGIQYHLVAEVQDASVKKTMGIEGIGLISLPDFAAKPYIKEGKLFKIGSLKDVREDYWLISKKRKNQIAHH